MSTRVIDNNLFQWIKELKSHSPDVPVFLVGTMSDKKKSKNAPTKS